MARRFRFTLQKVLDLRADEEKQAEILLAAKTGQRAVCEREIEELLVRRREAFVSGGIGAIDLNAWAYREHFRQRLGRDIEKKEKELARLTVEREDLLTAYLAARRRREVLSKLAEKRALAFKKAEDKREAAHSDDLNTAAFIRKMKSVEVPFGQV
jgi:flagellar FliJ protein